MGAFTNHPKGEEAQIAVDPATTFVKYSDATYEYYCEAAPGTARSTEEWQVQR